MYTYSITLRTGERFDFATPTRKPYWKSWVLHQLTYGTDVQGATFTKAVA